MLNYNLISYKGALGKDGGYLQGGAFIDHATSVPRMDHGLQGYHEGITGRTPGIPDGITGRTPHIPEHKGMI